MMEEIKHVKCGKCKCWRLPEQYLNARGRKLKTCALCRARSAAYRARTKCEHGKRKTQCKVCVGGSICEHKRVRSHCNTCTPMSYLRIIARSRIHGAMKGTGKAGSLTMLGCSVEEFKEHITAQLRDGMTWENFGQWHIDHIVPLKYVEHGSKPTVEDTIARLHYTNTQPLWASENMIKGNRYVGRPGGEQ